MKTAMQELIEWVNVNDLSIKTSLYNNELINKLKQLQEKEKEQIMKAFESGWNWNYDSEKYYKETYNQK
jgi:hypothetical protein